MESFEDSNCHSMSDSFSLYERYLRSFNVVDNFIEENNHREPVDPASSSSNCEYDTSNSVGNIELCTAVQSNVINKHCEITGTERNSLDLTANHDVVDKGSTSLDIDLCVKVESSCTSPAASLLDNSSATVENSILTEKSDPADVPVSSEESKPDCFKQPVFITSTMENSNNAVDSVPMFCDVRHTESVFKLPISELSFNGTIKHVQKLKPIVDPITALTSANTGLVNLNEKSEDLYKDSTANSNDSSGPAYQKTGVHKNSDMSDDRSTYETSRMGKVTESTGDSQYEEFNPRKENQVITNEEGNSTKWNVDHSYSSDDSGVRSPDVFSDEEEIEETPAPEPFWNFLKDYEAHDKKKARKMEENIQGVLPPPSVTILKTDVTEMLKKYYCFLPLFNGEAEARLPEANVSTPEKGVSLVTIPTIHEALQESSENLSMKYDKSLQQIEKSKRSSSSRESTKSEYDPDNSLNDKSIILNTCTETEAKETMWPNLLKCRYYDVYYNATKYSEKLELLAQKCGERYVGAETDTSVNIYSGGMQSPSSACKRKALRLKMAQAKSPGRRLSHLARRRQAFCTAATISEKAQTSTSRMVLIDKNFFPHRKLIMSSERKSPRLKRTPGKKTPIRKTPGKKTPNTPKHGSSSHKKAMRRLQMDSETLTRSQPTRETLKRALFISPDNRKPIPSASSSSVPLQAMKSKRALFGSPIRADTKSSDGTQSDQFLKRKLDNLDDEPEYNRNKIAKSLSYGGDSIRSSQSQSLNRQTSEVLTTKNTSQLNETHKKKLLWAVSEALRVHGWRMSSPGFREKAAALARLTRRLLTLPPHAARLSAPKFSTSETMLKLARQYVFAIIQGRSIDECFQEEQIKIATKANSQKLTGYISASDYQQLKARQAAQASSTFTLQIKENTCNDGLIKQEQPRSSSKNVLQDKLVNIDTNSNSSSGLSMLDKVGIYKSNSMPSFEEAAKMRARRQISFDNVEFPKR